MRIMVWSIVVCVWIIFVMVLAIMDRMDRVNMGVVWICVTCVHWYSVHLLPEEDLGEGKTNRMAEFVVMLVLPLGHGVHELVVDVLAIDDQVVINVEDEVPGVGEGLAHILKLVKVSSNGSFALLKLSSDVSDDGTEIFNGVKDTVEGSVSELVYDSPDSLPDMLGISEAFNTMWHFSFNSSSKQTFKNLAHSEEGEMHIRGLHRFELVHLVVLFMVNLVQQLLPVVVEVKEEFLMLNHLRLAVQKHGSSLAEVLTCIKEVAHSVIVKTLPHVFEDIHAINNDAFSGL